jgi:putative holliday junction resolvase
MKYIGIDYGIKRIGLAISDDSGKLAFPNVVLSNDKNLFENFKKIYLENKIQAVVMGESRDFKGKANPIFSKSLDFKGQIEKNLSLKVFMMPEYLSTKQAEHIQGKGKLVDASAAAVILQSYLDKKNE